MGDWMFYPALNRVRIGPQWYAPVDETSPSREESAYDKGYDDGWDARDEVAEAAELAAYDRGLAAGTLAAIQQTQYPPLR